MEKMTVQDLEEEILKLLQSATHELIELLLDYLVGQVGIAMDPYYIGKKYDRKVER